MGEGRQAVTDTKDKKSFCTLSGGLLLGTSVSQVLLAINNGKPTNRRLIIKILKSFFFFLSHNKSESGHFKGLV